MITFSVNLLYGLTALFLVFRFNKKPIVLHGIGFFLYIFLMEWARNLLFFMLVLWLFSLFIVPAKKTKTKGSYDKIILILGILFFLGSIIGFEQAGTLTSEVFTNNILIRFCACVIWFFIIIKTLSNRKDLEQFIYLYCIIRGIEIVFFGFIQYIWGVSIITRNLKGSYTSAYIAEGSSRLFGLITFDPINSAYFLIFIIGIYFFWGFIKKRKYYITFFLLSVVALLLTWSRSAWIVVLLMLTTISFYNLKSIINKKTVLIFIVLLVIGMIIFEGLIQERFASDIRLQSMSNLYVRLLLYFSFFANINKLTLFGPGLISIVEISHRLTGQFISTENLFLQTYAARGIVGGSIILLLYCLTFYRFLFVFKESRSSGDTETTKIIVVLLSVFSAMTLLSLTMIVDFDDPIHWFFFSFPIVLSSFTPKTIYSESNDVLHYTS